MGIQLEQNGWFNSNIPWAEYVGAHGPGSPDGAMAYSQGNQQVMHIWVYAEDLLIAIWDLLGINLLPSSESRYIERVSPMRHPIMQWLYAERITSIKPAEFVEKSDFSTIDNSGSTTFPIVTSIYDRYLLSVLFTQPKYTVLDDGQLDNLYGLYNPSTHMVDADGTVRQEWVRFIEGVPQGKVEVMTIGQGTLTYRDTGTNGPTINVSNVQVPWRQYLNMNQLNKIWHKVPLQGLLDNFGNGKARALDTCLQHVNAFKFFNYAPGTLKFEGYTIIPLESVLAAQYQNPYAFVGAPTLLADVQLQFSIFDPPTDGVLHGHNNIPWGPTGKWYFASFASPSITFNGTSITASAAAGTNVLTLTGATVVDAHLGGIVNITGGSGFTNGVYNIIDIRTGSNTWTLDGNPASGGGSSMTGVSYGQPLFPAIDFYKIFQMHIGA